jgi:16S rRNA (adenine1518-N6/adenine1519-N6)-dimethyltransferase
MGQNFLIDQSMAQAIVADLPLKPGERVLEIGPGFGALTAALLEHPAGPRVFAVEKDLRLAEWLRDAALRLPEGRLEIVTADFLKVEPGDLAPLHNDASDQGLVVLGNLPYSVSTPIIMHLVELFGERIRLGQFLLQLEMAQRLSAAPGGPEYGAPTAKLGMMFDLTLTRRVPRNVFYPRPDIESAVVRLLPLSGEVRLSPADPHWDLAQRLIRAGFSQRRKKMARLCSDVLNRPVEEIESALTGVGLPADVRAERIAPGDWIALAGLLSGDVEMKHERGA